MSASFCTAEAVQAAAPPGMTIGPIADLNPQMPEVPTGARMMPARGTTPAYCLVTGSVVTNPGTGKTANFGAALPLAWNGKLLFMGCGGYCGWVFPSRPDEAQGGGSPSDALARGYPIIATDDGHATSPIDFPFGARWALAAPGRPDEDAVTDYFHRAVHAVAGAGKQLVQRWYGGEIRRSYFFGCSEGGREGMVEASRYPEDFDGYIVGDPFLDVPGQLLAGRAARALLRAPDSFIPSALLSLVDRAVLADCDAADGVKDGLIQNPGRCSFDPASLRCRGAATSACLSPSQVDTLNAWFSAARDEQGRVVSTGYPVSNLYDDGAAGNNLFRWVEAKGPPRDMHAAEPWGEALQDQPAGWAFFDQGLRYLVYLDPAFDSNRGSPVNHRGVVSEEAMTRLRARTQAGSSDDPRKLTKLLDLDRKVLLYHGYSDGFISPFGTVRFYEAWAELRGGYEALQRNARLFMVPGMYHCGGGPGPNTFDALGALEQWVERGRAPDAILAAKHEGDEVTAPALRTMPVCAFPTQARYSGEGDVNDAASWSCPANEDLLSVGPAGARAGLGQP